MRPPGRLIPQQLEYAQLISSILNLLRPAALPACMSTCPKASSDEVCLLQCASQHCLLSGLGDSCLAGKDSASATPCITLLPPPWSSQPYTSSTTLPSVGGLVQQACLAPCQPQTSSDARCRSSSSDGRSNGQCSSMEGLKSKRRHPVDNSTSLHLHQPDSVQGSIGLGFRGYITARQHSKQLLSYYHALGVRHLSSGTCDEAGVSALSPALSPPLVHHPLPPSLMSSPTSSEDGLHHPPCGSLLHPSNATNLTYLMATSVAEPQMVLSVFREAAAGMQWVHDASGLPWWASIPCTTLALRLALLPVSMWQAKTVRTNYMVYREAAAMTDRQLSLEARDKPGSALLSKPVAPGDPPPSTQAGQQEERQDPLSAADRVRRGKLVLSNFTLLRAKLEAPHPAWIIMNPLIQVPVFVVSGMTLRMMGSVGWPGLAKEGALWFPDLTKVAVVSSYTEAGSWALDFPMGPAGFVLPVAIFAATWTSLRIGFGAAGARTAPADDWVGQMLRVLPPLLYGMTFVNLWVKLQLPHCALLHWAASSAFTLGLQVSLQQPAFRAAFNLPSPKELQELLGRLSGVQLQKLEEASSSLAANSRGYVVPALPQKLVTQVSEETSPDVLVVLGAQHSAQRRYREALFCLDKALQMQPEHVRAHYSRGQVFSLSGRWLDAQACFERAADLAAPGSAEKGQATYCIATAMHTQGNLAGAIIAYKRAAELWPAQPVISYSLANALLAQNRLEEAKHVVQGALQMSALRNPHAPFRQQFLQLQEKIENATGPIKC